VFDVSLSIRFFCFIGKSYVSASVHSEWR